MSGRFTVPRAPVEARLHLRLLLEGRLDDGRLEGVLTPILRGRGPLATPDLRWSVTRDGC